MTRLHAWIVIYAFFKATWTALLALYFMPVAVANDVHTQSVSRETNVEHLSEPESRVSPSFLSSFSSRGFPGRALTICGGGHSGTNVTNATVAGMIISLTETGESYDTTKDGPALSDALVDALSAVSDVNSVGGEYGAAFQDPFSALEAAAALAEAQSDWQACMADGVDGGSEEACGSEPDPTEPWNWWCGNNCPPDEADNPLADLLTDPFDDLRGDASDVEEIGEGSLAGLNTNADALQAISEIGENPEAIKGVWDAETAPIPDDVAAMGPNAETL